MLIISTEACQLSVALSGRFHAGSEILLITNLFFHFSPLRRWIIATYRLVQSVYVHPACPKWWYTPKCFCFVSSMSTYFDPGPIEKDPPKQRDCVYIYIYSLAMFFWDLIMWTNPFKLASHQFSWPVQKTHPIRLSWECSMSLHSSCSCAGRSWVPSPCRRWKRKSGPQTTWARRRGLGSMAREGISTIPQMQI